MNKSFRPSRLHWNGIALAIAGIFFVLYPALRPFSDEVSLQGAAAFGSPYWLLAHMLAMVAFTLLSLGLLGMYSTLQNTTVERVGYWAFVLSLIDVGFALPFYGIVDTLAERE